MICECEFVATSVFKKLQPKPNYIAPYVRLPWNAHRGMIGQAVNIFKTEWGFAVVTDLEKFKPAIHGEGKADSNQSQNEAVLTVATSENQLESHQFDNRAPGGRFELPRCQAPAAFKAAAFPD